MLGRGTAVLINVALVALGTKVITCKQSAGVGDALEKHNIEKQKNTKPGNRPTQTTRMTMERKN